MNISVLKRNESLKDHCGVFGIFSPKEDVARISSFGLYSLQHRGQEGAGIVVTDGKKLKSVHGLGLVSSVFNENNISSLKGFAAIGHNRYSTTGSNTINNVQPIILPIKNDPFALAHNGNIINSAQLRKKLFNISLHSTTDSEVIGWSIFQTKGSSWEEKILNSINNFKGAFSITALSKDTLYAFRDAYGFRPLSIGKLNGGYVICSETCALEIIGSKYIRDVHPGEVIAIDKNGLHEIGQIKNKKKSFCIFEYVYFARPDSIFKQELVHQVRQRSGEILSYEAPVAGDLVVAVPDSGTSAAIGYSKASGIPFGEILIKNRYIGRTFIQPEQRVREMGVRIKFNPLKKIVKGKRIIIVDDSIVRGTTIKKIIELLKKFGAKKIHVRICSPPIPYACYFGIDTPDPKRLIASEKNVREIKKYIGADSLAYLSLSGLVRATRQKKKSLCTACFNGKYPLPIDQSFDKNIFEKIRLAVLISNAGTGTNLQAIIDEIESKKLKAEITVVVSDTKDAYGLVRAKKHNLQTYIVKPKENLTKILKEKYKIDYIALTGWKQIIPDSLINSFPNKIFNIHPGLIPDSINGVVKNPDGTNGLWNRGKLTDRAIENFLNKKATYVGSSVHFLSKDFDFGPVLRRCFEKIRSDDTIDSLYTRLKVKENNIYIEAIKEVCQ